MPLGILTTIGFEAILRVFDCDMPKGTDYQRFRGVTVTVTVTSLV